MNKKLPVELIGIIKGAIITLVLCLLATLVIYYTEIQETVMPVIGNVILAIGIFWCSCYVSKSYGTKGLLRGLSMGLAFFILMLITTFVADFSLISLKTFLYTLSLCLISGGLGGILGVGLSDKSI